MWKKGTSLEEEVTKEDFDSTTFIDRVFVRLSGEMRETGLDVEKLKSNFEVIISNLQLLKAQYNHRATLIQQKCILSETTFKDEIKKIQNQTKNVNELYSELDARVRQVSDKVYIGDQLERKYMPRNELAEAKSIIFEFYKYISGSVSLHLSKDEDEDILLEVAERIQKLSNLCVELPDDESFIAAKNRIKISQDEVDSILISRFESEMSRDNLDSMKRIIKYSSLSKKYPDFISVFVKYNISKIKIKKDLMSDLIPFCKCIHDIIEQVFPNKEVVMLQIFQALFYQTLQKYIDENIPNSNSDLEQYLIKVYFHYVKIDELVKQITIENFIHDNSALSKLFKDVFKSHLANYMQLELNWLTNKLTRHLSSFYSSIGHTKRQINDKGVVDFLQSKFNVNSSSNSAEERDSSSNKQLLSQEVSVSILEDVKLSLKRCKMLSSTTELSEDVQQIMKVLDEYLIDSYLYYGICISLQSLSNTDSKREPNLNFFQVVHEVNNIFQFYDKVVSDFILPTMTNPTIHEACVEQRQKIMKHLEDQINQGLEKLMSNCLLYIQNILNTEQKRTDYRPDSQNINYSTSHAASSVVSFVRKLPPMLDMFLDGQNRQTFSHEFGLQMHRLLMDHLYSFNYSCEGGYVAMQDVNLYDETMRRFHSPLLNQLFNVLLTLVNVVTMKPDNLSDILKNHLDSGIPKELLSNFVNLRVDHKQLNKNILELK